MHMEFLYGSGKQDSVQAKKFLDQQRKLRTGWLKELKLSEKEAEKIYDLVEWCDAASLLICTDLLQPEKRSIEISQGPDKQKYQLIKISEGVLTVSPWPFSTGQFEVRYDYREIDEIVFKSSAGLRQKFLEAPVFEKKWLITSKTSDGENSDSKPKRKVKAKSGR